ncbi:MAG: hypothetical protein ACSLFN_15950 [Candidatus Limnocylindrales bacterium]
MTTQISQPTIDEVAPPSTRVWLRPEGLAAFVAGLVLFVALGGP